MIGPIVPMKETSPNTAARSQTADPAQPLERADPLSEVLALLKPQSFLSGAFGTREELAVSFPKHEGIKCYAMLAGQCWLVVESLPEPVLLRGGDCFLLPRGLPFRLTSDLSLEPVSFLEARERLGLTRELPEDMEGLCYVAGGHFLLAGAAASMILSSLPPIVHLRRESDRAAMRWSLERMREELRNPQLGGSLIAQQLAYMMLVQALRLHLADTANAVPGWLAALSDRHMSLAIACIHTEPGHPWTLQSLAERVGMSRSVFALRFREIVGTTPMDYLTRWRMYLAAERLKNSSEGLSAIAQEFGYESDSAFGKAFRRVMGCSPRQYGRNGNGRQGDAAPVAG
jgi:AraC-like DNA-binding protein